MRRETVRQVRQGRPRYGSGEFRRVNRSSKTTRKIYKPKGLGWRISVAGGWLVALVVTIAIVVILVTRVFVVRKVVCIINSSPTACSESLWRATDELLGKPMLFYNVSKQLESVKSVSLDFDEIKYYKVLPGQVTVDFQFPAMVYQVAIDDGVWRNYARDGRYTISPEASGSLQIHSHYFPYNQALSEYGTDPIIHQKFLDLDYYSTGRRDRWERVDLVSLTELRITTPETVYVVDLFDLDRDMQKLWYVEKNYRHENGVEIDLRFNSPMVRLREN